MVGWTTPCLIDSAVAINSTPPLAPSRWPIMLLVLLIASLRAWSPKTVLIASVSASSPSGVLVPWALTYWIASGLSRASRSAWRIAAEAHAVEMAVLGPLSPNWIEMLPDAELAIILGMTNGLILPGPPSR